MPREAKKKRSLYEEITIPIDRTNAGVRIDRVLRKLLPALPLSHLYLLFRKGAIRCATRHGAKARASERFDRGEILQVKLRTTDTQILRSPCHPKCPTPGLTDEHTPGGEREEFHKIKRGLLKNLSVLYEDDHIIALDKPAGMAVHPGTGHPLETTVVGALWSLVGKGTGIFRPGLVGRLDRDTSGVQLAGKSPEGLRGMEALSRQRGIRKIYWALVRGEELPSRGRIDDTLWDRGKGGKRMTTEVGGGHSLSPRGFPARTDYRVIKRGNGATLVAVIPQTGRMHQIRAHFASRGFPVAGDPRYGEPRWNRKLRQEGMTRLFLHCRTVAFSHPVMKRMIKLHSPLPSDLIHHLNRLKLMPIFLEPVP